MSLLREAPCKKPVASINVVTRYNYISMPKIPNTNCEVRTIYDTLRDGEDGYLQVFHLIHKIEGVNNDRTFRPTVLHGSSRRGLLIVQIGSFFIMGIGDGSRKVILEAV